MRSSRHTLAYIAKSGSHVKCVCCAYVMWMSKCGFVGLNVCVCMYVGVCHCAYECACMVGAHYIRCTCVFVYVCVCVGVGGCGYVGRCLAVRVSECVDRTITCVLCRCVRR